MKRTDLLTGSLGLLGLLTLAVPALAAEAKVTIKPSEQTTATILQPAQSFDHIAIDAAASSEFPEATAKPEAATLTQGDLTQGSVIAQQPDQPLDNSIAQVTSVSELSDVQPTDWAFQAVQSLVERYGCIEGYPDKTFRGNRAATRYELAAALNACLNQISERFVTAEDLATIRQLQDEFAAELATLRGRVDALEARTSELEANQFSTTTKLQGEAILAGQYGEQDGAGRATALARVRLNFNTSFTGNDLLQTQLELGNQGEDLIGRNLQNGLGVLTTFPAAFGPELNGLPFTVDLGALDYAEVDSTAALRRLSYTFRPTDNLAITFGPRLFPSDFVDFNSYANNSAQDFSSGFFINNPLIITNAVDFPGGAGAAVDWNFGGGPVTLRAVYVAASPTNAIANTFGGGLFGDPYQATAELEFSPSNTFAVRLQYTNATTNDIRRDAYGVNAELSLGNRLGLFGRYGYGEFDSFGVTAAAGIGDFNAQSFMAGIALRDLLVPGSLLGFAYGQPFFGNDVDALGTQRNYEAFYRIAVNNNIAVTPAVLVITDPNNGLTDAGTIYQGVLRTTFSF